MSSLLSVVMTDEFQLMLCLIIIGDVIFDDCVVLSD